MEALPPDKPEPTPQIHQPEQGRRQVGEGGGFENATGAFHIFGMQISPFFKDRQGPPEAGIPFHGQGDQMHQRADAHGPQPGKQHEYAYRGDPKDAGHDRQPQHEIRSDFFRLLGDAHEFSPVLQEFIALIILQRMAHFMGGHHGCRERLAGVMLRGQSDEFGFRIVMIAERRGFHAHMLQAESIQQMAGQLPTRSGKILPFLPVLTEDPPHPQLRSKHDSYEKDEKKDHAHRII